MSIGGTVAKIQAETCFPAFKVILQHSPLFFYHFGGYFSSIKGTIAKIRQKRVSPALELVLRHLPFF